MARKIPGKLTIIVFLTFFITCCSFLIFSTGDSETAINDYYIIGLRDLQKSLLSLKNSCEKKEGLAVVKSKFLLARLSYKKFAVLSEYYYQNESRLLNGPALARTEEDNPGRIIAPHGFQVIENWLFGQWNNKQYILVAGEIKGMMAVLDLLGRQPNRAYMFRKALAWDAIRASSVRLVTLGITGYDSPLAMYSLKEAGATIKGIKDLLAIFGQFADRSTRDYYREAFVLLDSAVIYLKQHSNFNEFDRLAFITRFINPFYGQLKETRVASYIPIPQDHYPVNFNTNSIFSDTAFNIDFFSPGGDYTVTADRVELGKKLFFDTLLSGTRDRSCATCHKPELAFTDGLKTALSIDRKTFLTRNTPTILNAGLQSREFFDSRADILENQLNEVVHNNEEMKGSLAQSIQDLKANEVYSGLFKVAYSSEKDPVTGFNIANAISSYIRSLTLMNSRFDQYMHGDTTRLTIAEKKGFNLFMGKAKCATCHHPPLFNGLLPPEFIETESEVLGVPQTTDTIHPNLDPDLGKFLFSQSALHKYSFKTPTLRNVALTAPYMHNGVYKTMEEVVDFYNKGGGKGLKIAPENQTLPFDKLNLSKKEAADIVSFMKTLTDTVYVNRHIHQ